MDKLIFSKPIYKGRIFSVTLDRIELENKQYEREIIHHPGSAVILPVFDDGTIALVRQYRHAVGKFLLELPAGTVAQNEDPLSAAVRELEEEIGVTCSHMKLLGEFFVSPGFLDEKMYIFCATGLTDSIQKLEDDEFLTIEYFKQEKLLEMAKNGEIEDAKTLIGLFLYTASEIAV
ncbi:MAG TPA: NUDIX hydrolase [Pyrinomonadaceae bacterium]|jgi:ADP-ribose pyrophosphatase|nr:NUDIX hydrolase [Pyrinomonadaceae bacterium]